MFQQLIQWRWAYWCRFTHPGGDLGTYRFYVRGILKDVFVGHYGYVDHYDEP